MIGNLLNQLNKKNSTPTATTGLRPYRGRNRLDKALGYDTSFPASDFIDDINFMNFDVHADAT
ncbi:3165_t:CDS:2, partial [Paraglomus occultum]